MKIISNLATEELHKLYAESPGTSPSWALKRQLHLRCRQVDFLRELSSRGVSLRGGDDVHLDYPDDPSWSLAEWEEKIRRLRILCLCGCEEPIKIKNRRYNGLPKYLKNHRGRGKPLSEKRKANISKSLKGRTVSKEFRQGRRDYMLQKWQDPAYRKDQSQRMTEVNADPTLRQKHREIMLAWVAENPDHHVRLAQINRTWAKNNPQKKMEAARKGHIALAGRGKQSSIERNLERALRKARIPFISEWEYPLGVADFKVGDVIIFADGDYWHGPAFPKQQAKDRRQDSYLEQQGFLVLRFWERDINSDIETCMSTIQAALSLE